MYRGEGRKGQNGKREREEVILERRGRENVKKKCIVERTYIRFLF